MAQDAPKTAPRRPKTPPRRPKIPPRRPKRATRRPKGGPERHPRGPPKAKDGPRAPQDGPRDSLRGPERSPGPPQEAPGRPKNVQGLFTHTGGCRWFPTIFPLIFFPIMARASVPIQTKKQDQRSGRRPHERTALHSQTIADTPPSPSFINAHDLAAAHPAYSIHRLSNYIDAACVAGCCQGVLRPVTPANFRRTQKWFRLLGALLPEPRFADFGRPVWVLP